MAGLNPRQEEACSYTEGPLLILAGAGSGKTRVITHRIAHLIEDKGVNPFNILAITFTNKAAGEMRTRVDAIIGPGAEKVWVSTFHALCSKVMRRFYERLGGTKNFTIYDADDQRSAMKEVLRQLNLDEKQYPVRGMITAISRAKESLLSPDEFEDQTEGDFRNRNIARIYREYQKRLESSNAMDFDDLICKTIDLFLQEPEVLELYQERFRYIMVDEYQDTNHAQFILVKLLAAKYRNLCVVGDDDQSIYKFRGANIRNILNFEEEYPDAKVVKLEQNYRSTKNILDVANAVIANNSGRKDKSLWTRNEEGEKVHFTRYRDDRGEAAGVCKKIFALLRKGGNLQDMAVLYRTNAQSRVLEEQLIRENIPYQLVGGTNFYARKEIRDLVGYLKCVANTADDIALVRIINYPRRGIGDTTVKKLKDFASQQGISLYDAIRDCEIVPGVGRAVGKLRDFAEMMEGFQRTAERGDLTRLYLDILSVTGYQRELEAERTDEARSRLENLQELRNKITEYETKAEEATLVGLLEEISLVADTDSLEEDSDRLTLMTLHSAKGLEYPDVFLVGMEDRLFPSGMALDSDDPDAEEEERRLCYVGITRAEKRLYLSAATQRMTNGTVIYPDVSRFIHEIPETLLVKDGIQEDGGFYTDVSDFSDSYYGDSRSGSSYGGARAGRFEAPKKDDTPDLYYDEWQGSTFQRKGGSKNTDPDMEAGIENDKDTADKRDLSAGPGASVSASIFGYTVGDHVKHIKFGRGLVTEMIPCGGDFEVAVTFDEFGEKRMFASLAKLRKI